MKKKILIFIPGFEYKKNHSQTFVKTRIEQYIENGHEVDILSISKNKVTKNKNGLNITNFKNYNEINRFLESNIQNYDLLFVHFITFQFIKIINNLKKINIVIWIHGIEGQKWNWYLFDIFAKPFWLFKHIIYNILHLRLFRKFVLKKKDNVKFIFVSNWMKEVFFRDLGVNINKKNYSIIPNPVDSIFFNKISRPLKINNNILILKNFSSLKYAGDITIKYILKLSKTKTFKYYNFTIIGKGKILDKNIKFLKFSNIKIINTFISSKKLLNYQKKNCVFIYLTRMDSQSVTLSEALSSGMVCISSFNTAIPEFIDNKKDGFLIKNYDDFLKVLKLLKNNSKLINKISKRSLSRSQILRSNKIFNKEKLFIKL